MKVTTVAMLCDSCHTDMSTHDLHYHWDFTLSVDDGTPSVLGLGTVECDLCSECVQSLLETIGTSIDIGPILHAVNQENSSRL